MGIKVNVIFDGDILTKEDKKEYLDIMNHSETESELRKRLKEYFSYIFKKIEINKLTDSITNQIQTKVSEELHLLDV